MSKISSIFLRVPTRIIKFAGSACVFGILSGCWGPLIEPSVYLYGLRIENSLTATIDYCYTPSRDAGCHSVIGGSSQYITYMSYDRRLNSEEMYDTFDGLSIVICDRTIDLKRIRSVSPIIKRENYRFEIIIDKAVSDAFCR